mgnify:CR=1 FL=1
MFDEEFRKRLLELRTEKGISARDMSLSIGQNPNYINFIESGRSMPSMTSFFFICEFLDITPAEFFEIKIHSPKRIRDLTEQLQVISPHCFNSIADIVKELSQK